MSYDRRGREHGRDAAGNAAATSKVGAGTLIQALGGELSGAPAFKVGGSTLTQQLGDGDGSGGVHQVAAGGITGAAGPLPHRDTIQRAFGRHDVSGIEAHTGGAAEAATRALGAEAYATDQHVAFAGAPSLHTAAHEAAHVVQQRGGIQLKGGVGAAGDAHEQHADAVADVVVRGGSAEGLLDPYAPGSGEGGAVQAKGGAIVQLQGTGTSPDAAVAAKLDRVPAPTFAGITEGTFDITGVTAWMVQLTQLIDEAKAVAGGKPLDALDRCASRVVPQLTAIADQIRAATTQLTNDSSVTKQAPAKVAFPTQAQVTSFDTAAGKINQLGRDTALPAGDATKASLQSVGGNLSDAGLAILQSLSVVAARDRWKKGSATETPSAGDLGPKRARTEIDEIFKDSGFSGGVSTYTDKDGNKHIYDWCGIFAAASYFTGGGLAKQLRDGFYHTDNVQDFFHYKQDHNPDRSPASIWAEQQWWNLKAYHTARGSVRTWTPRDTIQLALKSGGAVDIRPGDCCLIDHQAGNNPTHIAMVESYDPVTQQLVTIEGNTWGIHADADGKAERVDDAHLKKSVQGEGTAAGIHVRDLRKLAPRPGSYVVTYAYTYVRDDADHTKNKLVDDSTGKKQKVQIPVNTSVEVTEIDDTATGKYANVKDWGWVVFNYLDTTGTPPPGGYKDLPGATVWGVGRLSAVDFEDGHEYAVHDVPADLKTTSPDQIRELAKKKDKPGREAKAIGLK